MKKKTLKKASVFKLIIVDNLVAEIFKKCSTVCSV